MTKVIIHVDQITTARTATTRPKSTTHSPTSCPEVAKTAPAAATQRWITWPRTWWKTMPKDKLTICTKRTRAILRGLMWMAWRSILMWLMDTCCTSLRSYCFLFCSGKTIGNRGRARAFLWIIAALGLWMKMMADLPLEMIYRHQICISHWWPLLHFYWLHACIKVAKMNSSRRSYHTFFQNRYSYGSWKPWFKKVCSWALTSATPTFVSSWPTLATSSSCFAWWCWHTATAWRLPTSSWASSAASSATSFTAHWGDTRQPIPLPITRESLRIVSTRGLSNWLTAVSNSRWYGLLAIIDHFQLLRIIY